MVGGIVSVLGVALFDKYKIDDPVGALSVHGIAGIWVSGTMDGNLHTISFLCWIVCDIVSRLPKTRTNWKFKSFQNSVSCGL